MNWYGPVAEGFAAWVILLRLIGVAVWIEKGGNGTLSFDYKPHNILRLPYEQPFNTSLGCGFIVFLLVLLSAGGDDVIAVATERSVVMIRTLLRIMVFRCAGTYLLPGVHAMQENTKASHAHPPTTGRRRSTDTIRLTLRSVADGD